MNINKDIKKILVDKEITLSELAKELGSSISNLSNKLRKNDMRISEYEKILNLLGYELKIQKKED